MVRGPSLVEHHISSHQGWSESYLLWQMWFDLQGMTGIHSNALSLIPISASRWIRMPRCNVSNAELKFSKHSTTSRLWLRDMQISLKIFTTAVSVLWFGRYALWNRSFMLLFSRNILKCFDTCLSSYFAINGIWATGL